MVEQYLIRHPEMGRQITILSQREGKFTDALVPISLIYREDVPVEEVHVVELAASMRHEGGVKRSGQLSPVLLACIPDFPQLPILDGFHRVAALNQNGQTEVFSTIRPTSSWEEVTDLRILTAETHRSIRFSRLVEWVEDAWNRSQWADRVRVNQAFALRYAKSMTGERIGINPDEAQNIRDWVDRKCEQWHMKPGSVYQHLLTAQSAAPDLIKEARERSGGSSLQAITPQHLKEISLTLPYKHELQRTVARVATEQTLTVRMTRALSIAVARARSTEEAEKIIDAGRWKAVEPVSTPVYRRPITEIGKEIVIDPELIEKLFEAELKIAELTIENAQLAGRYIPYERIPEPRNHVVPENNTDATPLETEESEIVVAPPMRLSDDQINDVLTKLYKSQPHVQHYLSNKFGIGPDEVEDIFSDMMLRTVAAINRGKFEVRSDKELEAWAVKVARNVTIDKHRQEQRRVKTTELREELIHDEAEDENFTREFNRMEQEYQRMIKACLPHLSEAQRRTFVLKTYFELPYIDIAQILGVNQGTLRERLSAARESMANLIASGQVA